MSLEYDLCIDSFKTDTFVSNGAQDRNLFVDELRIHGWFIANRPVAAMKVVLIGDGTTTLAIGETALESFGLYQLFGGRYGERALACRFQGGWPVPPSGTRYEGAHLQVTFQDRTVLEHTIATPELKVVARCYSDEERHVLATFDSIGNTCEFGLVQRRAGIERISLLRYAGVFDAPSLARAIAARFEGFGEGDDLSFTLDRDEWVGNVASARINFHTGRVRSTTPLDRIAADERVKLAFFAQKFIDDLEDGEKSFVYRTDRDGRGGPDGTYGIDEIYDAIAAHGTCPLLWVTPADASHPHARIEHVRGRLFRGYIDALAPIEDAHAGRDGSWIELLTEARTVIDDPTRLVA